MSFATNVINTVRRLQECVTGGDANQPGCQYADWSLNSTSTSSEELGAGPIVGIVLAALTVAIVIGVAGYYAYKYTTDTPKGTMEYQKESQAEAVEEFGMTCHINSIFDLLSLSKALRMLDIFPFSNLFSTPVTILYLALHPLFNVRHDLILTSNSLFYFFQSRNVVYFSISRFLSLVSFLSISRSSISRPSISRSSISRFHIPFF
jgi:hypothetical protein